MMRNAYHWDFAPDSEVKYREFAVGYSGTCLTKRPGGGSLTSILLSHPSIWLVYMLRDPRDIISSIHGRAPDRYWTSLDQWRKIRKKFVNHKPHARLIQLRYEDLVSGPDKLQEELERQIPWLEQIGKFSDFHTLARPSQESQLALRTLRKADTNSIGKWHNHLPRVAGQIERYGSIQAELQQDGYERDNSWLQILDGVTPDMSLSVSEEAIFPNKTARLWLRSQAVALLVWGRILKSRLVNMLN